MTEIMEPGHFRPVPASSGPCPGNPSWTPWVRALAWGPLVVVSGIAAGASRHGPPWLLMWVLSSSLWLGLKWATLVDAHRVGLRPSLRRSVAYMLAWPSTDAVTFLNATYNVPQATAREWAAALLRTCFGLALLY